jgi:hypothetical protein
MQRTSYVSFVMKFQSLANPFLENGKKKNPIFFKFLESFFEIILIKLASFGKEIMIVLSKADHLFNKDVSFNK